MHFIDVVCYSGIKIQEQTNNVLRFYQICRLFCCQETICLPLVGLHRDVLHTTFPPQ
jgi:hypothetical protein